MGLGVEIITQSAVHFCASHENFALYHIFPHCYAVSFILTISCSFALLLSPTHSIQHHPTHMCMQNTQQQRSRSHLPFPQQSIMNVIRNRTYNTFYETMQHLLGQNTSLEELALVFKFTKLAIKVAHKMGQRASTIKMNSIRYIGDRFAEWLDSQGGWVRYFTELV